MPGFTQQKTLRYEEHAEEIAALAHAIDLLGHHDAYGALRALMERRAHLLESQRPQVQEYNPRTDLPL